MTTYLRAFTVIAVLACGTGAFAAEPSSVRTEERKRDDKTQTFAPERLSQCIGKDVYNQNDKKIGTIDNIVLDGGANRISYAVLSYGGYLGMGDKLFAVPFGALEHRAGEPKRVYLNVGDDVLKKAPGFNKDNWPDMGDAAFRKQIDSYYQLTTEGRAQNPPENTKDKAAAEKSRLEAAGPNTGPLKQGLVWTRRVSDVIGANVKNESAESIGEIKDIVADTNNGEIRYAVLSFGGFMGMGDKLFAIPFTSLRSKSDTKEFVLAVSKEQLKNAPGFDKNNYPDWADEKYRTSVDKYYRTSMKD